MSQFDSHDVVSILSSEDRDYLVRNNCDQVKMDSLKGKKIGLYFSASWCGPCRKFTPALVEVYNELASKGDFEIVFVTADADDDSFNAYLSIWHEILRLHFGNWYTKIGTEDLSPSKMPWLAIPFSDSKAREHLDELFAVSGIPHLVILGESGDLLTEDGVDIIREHRVEAYLFMPEKIKELKEQEQLARRERSLGSILVARHRDSVISSNRSKVAMI